MPYETEKRGLSTEEREERERSLRVEGYVEVGALSKKRSINKKVIQIHYFICFLIFKEAFFFKLFHCISLCVNMEGCGRYMCQDMHWKPSCRNRFSHSILSTPGL